MTRNLSFASLLFLVTLYPCGANNYAEPSDLHLNAGLALDAGQQHPNAVIENGDPVYRFVSDGERPIQLVELQAATEESMPLPKSTHTWLDSDEKQIYNYDIDIKITDFPAAANRNWLYYFALQVNFTDHDEWSHGGFQWSGTEEFKDNNNKGVNWGGGSNWAGYGGLGVTNTPYTWETGKWYRFRVWQLDKDEAGRWQWLFAVMDYETGEERQLGTIITKSEWIKNAVVWIETGYGVECDTDRARAEWRNPVFRSTTPGEFHPTKATSDYNGTCQGTNNTNQGLLSKQPLRWFQSTNMPRSIAPGTRLWGPGGQQAVIASADTRPQTDPLSAAAPTAPAVAPQTPGGGLTPVAVTPSTPSAPAEPSAATMPPTSSTPADIANELLGEHNRIRADVGVGALTWSTTIAAYAQEWANRLASKGCPLEHRTNGRYGENLAAWTGRRSPGDAARLWEEERPQYDGGVMNNKNFAAGHYTQIVWRKTQSLGCAQASCGATTLVVCNYDPPGNYPGEKAY